MKICNIILQIENLEKKMTKTEETSGNVWSFRSSFYVSESWQLLYISIPMVKESQLNHFIGLGIDSFNVLAMGQH